MSDIEELDDILFEVSHTVAVSAQHNGAYPLRAAAVKIKRAAELASRLRNSTKKNIFAGVDRA